MHTINEYILHCKRNLQVWKLLDCFQDDNSTWPSWWNILNSDIYIFAIFSNNYIFTKLGFNLWASNSLFTQMIQNWTVEECYCRITKSVIFYYMQLLFYTRHDRTERIIRWNVTNTLTPFAATSCFLNDLEVLGNFSAPLGKSD